MNYCIDEMAIENILFFIEIYSTNCQFVFTQFYLRMDKPPINVFEIQKI